MPKPTAEMRRSAKSAIRRATPRSLSPMLCLRILKKSPLVVYQASVPHQCRHRPDVGLRIDPGRCICQKIDGDADRLHTIYGTDAARQYLRAICGGNVLGQLDNAAILVIGL